MKDQHKQQERIEYLLQAIQNDHYSDDHFMIEDPSIRIELMQMGEPAIQALTDSFRDSKSPINAPAAAKTLARYGDERVVLPLIDVVTTTSIPTRQRYFAIRALGDLKDDRCILPLIELLNENDDIIVFNTLLALKDFDDPQLIRPMLSKMNHYFRGKSHIPHVIKPGDNTGVSLIHDFILAQNHREVFYPYLISAQDDENPIVRNAATGFLRRMGKIPYSVEEETFRGYLDTIRKRMNGLFDMPNPDHKSRIKINRIVDNFLPYYFADDETYKKWGTLLEKCADIPVDQLLANLQQIHQDLTPGVNTR